MVRWRVGLSGGWTRWFAWHPVRVGGEWLWLEWVERQFVGGGFGDCAVFYRTTPEWPYYGACCDQMRGEVWIDGKHRPEWCPVHTPRDGDAAQQTEPRHD